MTSVHVSRSATRAAASRDVLRRWLTVVQTLSIMTAWIVVSRPHESRRRESERYVQTFTSLGSWLTRLSLQSHDMYDLVVDGDDDALNAQ